MGDRRRLSICQVNTADKGGGAEAVALALHRAYRKRGHESTLAVGRKSLHEEGVVIIGDEHSRGQWARLCIAVAKRLDPQRQITGSRRFLRRVIEYPVGQPGRWLTIMKGHEDFDFPATRRLLSFLPSSPDVLHCHNLHGNYFDLRALPWLCNQLPIVLTLHDAWLSSGHCAHSPDGCEEWRTGCQRCPNLSAQPAILKDGAAFNWKAKKSVLSGSRLFVVAPSRWLLQKMLDSILVPSIVDSCVIPNGVDLNIFTPGNRKHSRDSLGLSETERIVLFVAHGIRNNPWKDYAMLKSTLEALSRKGDGRAIRFVGLGERQGEETVAPNMRIQFVTYQPDENVVASYYKAADLYIHPSKADTFPTTIIEAMACGIPVVASKVGGIPEQIDDGVNGFLVEPGNGEAMAERIIRLFDNASLCRSLGGNGKRRARASFDINAQAEAYLGFYSEVLNRRNGEAGCRKSR